MSHSDVFASVDPKTELRRIDRFCCERSFKHFAKRSYTFLANGTTLVWGWYLDAIAEHLQAAIEGDITRLIINVRNRSLKSTLSSILLHPWAWLTQPELRFFTGGHDQNLSVEHCWESRKLINTPWYQGLIMQPDGRPAWELAGDQNVKSFYANTLGGRRMSAQVGAGTGKGGHVFVIDDPLSIDGSYSEVMTSEANRWVRETVLSRLDDPETARVIIVQHRLRVNDTTGDLLKRDLGFEQLCLPLEHKPGVTLPVTSLGFEDPRTKAGESLSPKRWTPKVIAQDKEQFLELFEALCNQNPQARGKQLLTEADIHRWSNLPASYDVVQSWDTSFKGLDPTRAPTKQELKRSKTCGLVAAIDGPKICIVDCFFEHADFDEQEAAIKAMYERWPDTVRNYIEDEAFGAAMILRFSKIFRGVIPVLPRKSKYLRFRAIVPNIKNGDVLFPPDNYAPWVPKLIYDLIHFPNIEYSTLR